MMHEHRAWCVQVVESAEELARKLTETSWTLCTGFQVIGHHDYLFLNDSISEDGAVEFAVVKGGITSGCHQQIESITFSWCRYQSALAHIEWALAGMDDNNRFRRTVQPTLHVPVQHGRCLHCA